MFGVTTLIFIGLILFGVLISYSYYQLNKKNDRQCAMLVSLLIFIIYLILWMLILFPFGIWHILQLLGM